MQGRGLQKQEEDVTLGSSSARKEPEEDGETKEVESNEDADIGEETAKYTQDLGKEDTTEEDPDSGLKSGGSRKVL